VFQRDSLELGDHLATIGASSAPPVHPEEVVKQAGESSASISTSGEQRVDWLSSIVECNWNQSKIYQYL
jgi:hypothetical protein